VGQGPDGTIAALASSRHDGHSRAERAVVYVALRLGSTSTWRTISSSFIVYALLYKDQTDPFSATDLAA